jgi:glutamate carboxypeptidase
MNHQTRIGYWLTVLFLLVAGLGSDAFDQVREPVLSLAKKEKTPLLDTLKQLVSIETGSRDFEGLAKLANLIAGRLKDLGGQVEQVEPSDVYKMEDTPEKIGQMVRATFKGTGTKKILLIAHMDTVYPRGMLAQQPFRIDGDRAYGLGIADDKHGIALILHTLAMLKTLNFRDYGTLTVLINADEELSSPGSRSLISKLGAEHDATFSVESSRAESDKLSLATSGIASVTLTVKGRASHSGNAPERGVNALYELAHQVLQTRDLSNPAVGLKMNWTLANAGTTRNMIPPGAQAGQKLRLRGRGFPGTPNGDQFVLVKLVTPAAETPQAREAYERMRREFNFNPRASWP